jgi:hypothetical protein
MLPTAFAYNYAQGRNKSLYEELIIGLLDKPGGAVVDCGQGGMHGNHSTNHPTDDSGNLCPPR